MRIISLILLSVLAGCIAGPSNTFAQTDVQETKSISSKNGNDSNVHLEVQLVSPNSNGQSDERFMIGAVLNRLDNDPEDVVRVRLVQPDSPAQRAGLEADDVLLAFGDLRVTNYEQLIDAIQSRGSRKTDLLVKRGGETLKLQIKADKVEQASKIIANLTNQYDLHRDATGSQVHELRAGGDSKNPKMLLVQRDDTQKPKVVIISGDGTNVSSVPTTQKRVQQDAAQPAVDQAFFRSLRIRLGEMDQRWNTFSTEFERLQDRVNRIEQHIRTVNRRQDEQLKKEGSEKPNNREAQRKREEMERSAINNVKLGSDTDRKAKRDNTDRAPQQKRTVEDQPIPQLVRRLEQQEQRIQQLQQHLRRMNARLESLEKQKANPSNPRRDSDRGNERTPAPVKSQITDVVKDRPKSAEATENDKILKSFQQQRRQMKLRSDSKKGESPKSKGDRSAAKKVEGKKTEVTEATKKAVDSSKTDRKKPSKQDAKPTRKKPSNNDAKPAKADKAKNKAKVKPEDTKRSDSTAPAEPLHPGKKQD